MRFLLVAILGLMLANSNSSAASAVEPEPLNVLDRPLLTVKYDGSGYTHVGFTPDGKMLATENWGHIRLIDLQSGDVVRAIDTERGATLNFTAAGKFPLVESSRSVRICGLPTLVEEQTLPDWNSGAYAPTISPDSKLLAGATRDGLVELWDLAAKQKKATLGAPSEHRPVLAFSPDGKFLAVLGPDGMAGTYLRSRCDVYDLETKKIAHSAHVVGGVMWTVLRFSPDGNTLAILVSGTLLYMWDFRTHPEPVRTNVPEMLVGKPRIHRKNVPPHEGRPSDAPPGDYLWGMTAISPDFRTLAGVLENGKLALWDYATCKDVHLLPIDHGSDSYGDGVRSLAFSPDGSLIAIGNQKGVVQVWRVRGERQPLPSPQPIRADKLAGPWGDTAIDGLRTRLILMPSKPEPHLVAKLPPTARKLPSHEGIWWRVCLEIRNETDDERLIELFPGVNDHRWLVIHGEDGQPIPFRPIAGAQTLKSRAISIRPRQWTTANTCLLGYHHDLSRPGKYRLQFPQTEAPPEISFELTNPVLPASNVLEFVNEGPAVDIK